MGAIPYARMRTRFETRHVGVIFESCYWNCTSNKLVPLSLAARHMPRIWNASFRVVNKILTVVVIIIIIIII